MSRAGVSMQVLGWGLQQELKEQAGPGEREQRGAGGSSEGCGLMLMGAPGSTASTEPSLAYGGRDVLGWCCAECTAQQEYWGGNKSAPDLPGRTDTSSQLVFNLDSISKRLFRCL